MRSIVLLAVGLLVGCAQTPGTGTGAIVGPLPAAGIVETSPDSAGIQIVDVLPAGAVEIGAVEGLSCRNSALDPAPTEEKATAQVRQKAKAMGATGVAGIRYERGGTSFVTKCWSTIKATGTAFRYPSN
jgi:hypothetical protein